MNRRRWAWWFADLVVLVLVGVLGIGIGERIAEQRIDRIDRAENTREHQTYAEALELQNAQKCEAAQADTDSRLTVLYDVSGSTQPSIQLFHGLVNVSSPALPAQARPRWLIPAKVTPLVVGGTTAVAYSYFNPQSKTIEGPFVPQQNQVAEGAQQ